MKTRSSTPSHDTAADKTANPTPQPRSTTPSLDSAAGRKQARPPPANPYRTLTRSTSPPQGDLTSPTLLSEKGVDDDDHRPPPPPAPDERMATRRSDLCEEGNVDGMVFLHATGRCVTPLANTIASDPVHTVAMATKFPPEFLQAVNEQTVMSGIGEELDTAPTGGCLQESREDPVTTAPPQPGGFHDLLNLEFPATPDLDATAVRIWGFLEQGARRRMLRTRNLKRNSTTFGWNGRTYMRICASSMPIELTPGVLMVWWKTALPRATGRSTLIC
jgi:hypothetical protein